MVIIFSIICIFFYRGSIESTLTERVKESFGQSNIALSENLDVKFSGRDAYISGYVENSSDKDRVYDLVDNVEGVKLVYTDLKIDEAVQPIEIEEPTPVPVVEKIIEQPVVETVVEEHVEVVQEVIQEQIPEPQAIVHNNYEDVEREINAKIVYFDLDKTFLKPESEIKIQEVQSILSEYPDIKVRITGYTDRRGTEEHNMDLSKRRAMKVQNYLVGSGISQDQLEVDYKGEVIRNDLYYWKYYKLDRKVEFKFLNQVSH